MRIAMACEDDLGLKGHLSPHFGRCPFYTLVEVEDGEVRRVEVVKNPHYMAHAPGVVPEFIRSLGADVIIAGGMGRRAIDMFARFGIEAVTTGASAPLEEVLVGYLEGRIRGAESCRDDDHHHGKWGGRR